jgi:hypothetical protein
LPARRRHSGFSITAYFFPLTPSDPFASLKSRNFNGAVQRAGTRWFRHGIEAKLHCLDDERCVRIRSMRFQ